MVWKGWRNGARDLEYRLSLGRYVRYWRRPPVLYHTGFLRCSLVDLVYLQNVDDGRWDIKDPGVQSDNDEPLL